MHRIVFVLLAGVLIAGCSVPGQQRITDIEGGPDRILRHVVLINFNDSATGDDIAKVEAAFRMIAVRIEAVEGYEWGTNVSPEDVNRGYTHCFLLTFTSERNRDTYLNHPLHQDFGNILGPYLEQVLVIDYWAKK